MTFTSAENCSQCHAVRWNDRVRRRFHTLPGRRRFQTLPRPAAIPNTPPAGGGSKHPSQPAAVPNTPPAGGGAKHLRPAAVPDTPRPAAVPNTTRPAAVQNVFLIFSARLRLQLDSAHRCHQRLSHHREYRRCRVTRWLSMRASSRV